MAESVVPAKEKEPLNELDAARLEVAVLVGSLVDDILDNSDQFDLRKSSHDEELGGVRTTADGSIERVDYRAQDGSTIRAMRTRETIPEAYDTSRIFTDYFVSVLLAETGDFAQVITSEYLRGMTNAEYGDGVTKKRDNAAQDSVASLGGIKTVLELFRDSAQRS